MGIFRKRGPSIPDLKQSASDKMDFVTSLVVALIREIQDGVTFTFVKRRGKPLWKALWAFLTSDEEVSFPIDIQVRMEEEEEI